VLEKLRPLGERWPWFGTALRTQERMGEVNGNQLASSVTLSAFLALFPLLLVAIAVVGFVSSNDPTLGTDLVKNLGLTGNAADTMTKAIAQAEKSRKAASVIGFFGLLWSGLGLVGALQYAFNATWQVRGRGLRDKLGGLVWLGGAFVIFAASFGITTVLNFLPGFLAPLGILAGLAVNFALWLWAMKVLTNRDVGWKALVPGAVLGAVGFEILKAVGSIYVPRLVASSQALYGTLGIVFATLAWLLFFGRLLVYASVLNVVRWEEDHGTLEVEVEVPKLPGEVPAAAGRGGAMEPQPDVSVRERLT
jgi:membrane protein